MGTWRRALSLLAGVFVLIAAACTSGTTRQAGSAAAAWGWPGNATSGWLAPGEPHVQGKRDVTIAILSPGDTHDHGYYESFVDKASAIAAQNGWRVVTVDKVAPSRAAEAARALCRRRPDMVAIAASELKDAIPVASEAVCRKTVWYVAGGTGVTQTPYFVQTKDIESQSGYAAGYAAGLIMNDAHITVAGFLTGEVAGFTSSFEKAWATGIKAVVPAATVVVTYTGDFDDSAKAVEAYNAMHARGVGLVYPYLGGATFAVAAAANKDHVPVLAPGTDLCPTSTPKFAISVIFSPGDYFGAALAAFKNGTLRVGTSLTFHMGVDPVPTVKICNPRGNEAQILGNVVHQIGTGQVRPDRLSGIDDYDGYVPSPHRAEQRRRDRRGPVRRAAQPG